MKQIKTLFVEQPFKVFAVGTLMFLMIVSEIILLLDILTEFFDLDFEFYIEHHLAFETLAVVALGISLIIFGAGVWRLLRQNEGLRISVDLASGEFMKVMDQEFDGWELTVSEREVGLLLIKGLTIKEIAGLRKTTDGTIKSQSNAIYRKAGVKGRNDLVAYFIEDLLCGQKLTTRKNQINPKLEAV